MSRADDSVQPADLILHNGRVATLDERNPSAQAAAVRDGKLVLAGGDQDALGLRGDRTRVIELRGRTVMPGLADTHMHLIRGGLSYNVELRWDGVPSLADVLRVLREQARRTLPPQWVRVVGGWSEFQFTGPRLPIPEEIDAAAPDTPVFVLHLYDRALLNPRRPGTPSSRGCFCSSVSGTRSRSRSPRWDVWAVRPSGGRPGWASGGWPSPRSCVTMATPRWLWARWRRPASGGRCWPTTRTGGSRRRGCPSPSPWTGGSSKRDQPTLTRP